MATHPDGVAAKEAHEAVSNGLGVLDKDRQVLLPSGAQLSYKIAEALRDIRQAAESELLELLGIVFPSFFETIVLDLSHAMGYGTNRSDLQRVGCAGDGGIDGVSSLFVITSIHAPQALEFVKSVEDSEPDAIPFAPTLPGTSRSGWRYRPLNTAGNSHEATPTQINSMKATLSSACTEFMVRDRSFIEDSDVSELPATLRSLGLQSTP